MCVKYKQSARKGSWARASEKLLREGGNIHRLGRKYRALACVDACEKSDHHSALAKRAARVAVGELIVSALRTDFPRLLRETAASTGVSEIDSSPENPSEQLLTAAKKARKHGFEVQMKQAAIEAYSIELIKESTYWSGEEGRARMISEEFGFGSADFRKGRMKAFSGLVRVTSDPNLESQFHSRLAFELFRELLSERDIRSALVSAAADELSISPEGQLSGGFPVTHGFIGIWNLSRFTGTERSEFVQLAVQKCSREDNLGRALLIMEKYAEAEEALDVRAPDLC